jgi:Cu(I)/Ag(I) efflux system membrane fusion protein
MGRVEKLYHKNIGEYIQKGQPLMEVYSEELNNAKQEYLLALERQKVLDTSLINFNQVIQSAKAKLLLWGMSESDVKALAADNNVKLTTTFYSNESGYLTQLSVQEGDYVSEGSTIVQLADLSTLWAEAQVYSSQFAQLSSNASVTVQLPDINKEIRGKLQFVNPEISPDKRINLIRVTIPNPDNELKPGMPAYVMLKEGQHNVLSLPADAVIRDGKSASVWVQTSKNIFKIQMVTTGVESNDSIEIVSGLSGGEAVVTSGAYLINSEYVFKNGSSPMAGMKM